MRNRLNGRLLVGAAVTWLAHGSIAQAQSAPPAAEA